MFSSAPVTLLRPLRAVLFLLCSCTGVFAVGELVRCRLCFGKVSTAAQSCIHCGEPDFKPAQSTIEIHQLQDRDEVFFAINGEAPFTGWVVEGRYASGLPKSLQQYTDGHKHGQRTKWYENGQIMQVCFFKDGELHGAMEEWYENGLRMAEGNYEDGKLHGIVRRWHSNGKREAEYPYQAGKIEGILIQWNRYGAMTSKKLYEAGKLKTRLAVDPPPEKPAGEDVPPKEPPPVKPAEERGKLFDGLQFP